jgi:hypothetical protein
VCVFVCACASHLDDDDIRRHPTTTTETTRVWSSRARIVVERVIDRARARGRASS